MTSFDYHRFLRDKWGDPDRLTKFLSTYGHEAPRATVNQWFRRKSIPSDYFAILLALLKLETGADVKVEDYLL